MYPVIALPLSPGTPLACAAGGCQVTVAWASAGEAATNAGGEGTPVGVNVTAVEGPTCRLPVGAIVVVRPSRWATLGVVAPRWVLMTVPTVGRIDPHGGESDLARWAPRGVERLLDSAGIVGEVRGYGNVLSCVAALWGLAVEDLSSEELDVVDDRFPLGVLVRSVKPALLVP